MVVKGFRNSFAAAIYVAALAALGLHISHGMQSMLQTFGVTSEKTLPFMIKAAIIGAVVIFIGYIAIPASVMAGIIKG
jgi:succinate dehydrogenase / fumarate reductase cytochrome b subunit